MICSGVRWSLFLLALAVMSACKNLTITEILKAIREACREDDVIESIERSPEKMVAFVDDDPLGGKSLLMYAAAYNRLSVAEFLLRCGADVNQRSNFYGRPMNTPLIYAASWGHEEMVKLLLSAGAEVDIQGSMASTALMFAAVNGHKEVVKILLDSRAKMDLQDTKGQTALALASWYGHADVVKLLIDAGADLNIQRHMRYSGSTPIMKAQGMNELDIVSTLTQAGANLDLQDAYGYTVAHYMAKAKDEAGLEIVLPYCPNLTIREHEMNLTAADLALANGYISTAQLLLGHRNNSCLIHREMRQKDLSGMNDVVETFEAYTDRAVKATDVGERVSTVEHKTEADEVTFEIVTSRANLSRDTLEGVKKSETKDIDYGVAKLDTYSSEFLGREGRVSISDERKTNIKESSEVTTSDVSFSHDSLERDKPNALDASYRSAELDANTSDGVTEKSVIPPVPSDSKHEVYYNELESRHMEQPAADDYATSNWKEIDLNIGSSEPVESASPDHQTGNQVLVESDSSKSQLIPLEFVEESLTTPDRVDENINEHQLVIEGLAELGLDSQDFHKSSTEDTTSFRLDSIDKENTIVESFDDNHLSESEPSDNDFQMLNSDVGVISQMLSTDQKTSASDNSEVSSPETETVHLKGFPELRSSEEDFQSSGKENMYLPETEPNEQGSSETETLVKKVLPESEDLSYITSSTVVESFDDNHLLGSEPSDNDFQMLNSDVGVIPQMLSTDQKTSASDNSEVISPKTETVHLKGSSELRSSEEDFQSSGKENMYLPETETYEQGSSEMETLVKKVLTESEALSYIKSSDQGKPEKELKDFRSPEIEDEKPDYNSEPENEVLTTEAPEKQCIGGSETNSSEVLEKVFLSVPSESTYYVSTAETDSIEDETNDDNLEAENEVLTTEVPEKQYTGDSEMDSSEVLEKVSLSVPSESTYDANTAETDSIGDEKTDYNLEPENEVLTLAAPEKQFTGDSETNNPKVIEKLSLSVPSDSAYDVNTAETDSTEDEKTDNLEPENEVLTTEVVPEKQYTGDSETDNPGVLEKVSLSVPGESTYDVNTAETDSIEDEKTDNNLEPENEVLTTELPEKLCTDDSETDNPGVMEKLSVSVPSESTIDANTAETDSIEDEKTDYNLEPENEVLTLAAPEKQFTGDSETNNPKVIEKLSLSVPSESAYDVNTAETDSTEDEKTDNLEPENEVLTTEVPEKQYTGDSETDNPGVLEKVSLSVPGESTYDVNTAETDSIEDEKTDNNLESENEVLTIAAPEKQFTGDSETDNPELLEKLSLSVPNESTYDVNTAETDSIIETPLSDSRTFNEDLLEKQEYSDVEFTDQSIVKPDVDELHPYGERSSNEELVRPSTGGEPSHHENDDQAQQGVDIGDLSLSEEKEGDLKMSDSVIALVSQEESSDEQNTEESEFSDTDVSEEEMPRYQDHTFSGPAKPSEYEAMASHTEAVSILHSADPKHLPETNLEKQKSSMVDDTQELESVDNTSVPESIQNLSSNENESSEFQFVRNDESIQERSSEEGKPSHSQASDETQTELESGDVESFDIKVVDESQDENAVPAITVSASTEPLERTCEEKSNFASFESLVSEMNEHPDLSKQLPSEQSAYEVEIRQGEAVSELDSSEPTTSHETGLKESEKSESSASGASETYLSDDQTGLRLGDDEIRLSENETLDDSNVQESEPNSRQLPDSPDLAQHGKDDEGIVKKSESVITLLSSEELWDMEDTGESDNSDLEFAREEVSDGQESSILEFSQATTHETVILNNDVSKPVSFDLEVLYESTLEHSESSEISSLNEEDELETSTSDEEDLTQKDKSPTEHSETEAELGLSQSTSSSYQDQLELESDSSESLEENAVRKEEEGTPDLVMEALYSYGASELEESEFDNLDITQLVSEDQDLPTSVPSENELEKPEASESVLELPLDKTPPHSVPDELHLHKEEPYPVLEVTKSESESGFSDSQSSSDQVQPELEQSDSDTEEEASDETEDQISTSDSEEELGKQYKEETESNQIDFSKEGFSEYHDMPLSISKEQSSHEIMASYNGVEPKVGSFEKDLGDQEVNETDALEVSGPLEQEISDEHFLEQPKSALELPRSVSEFEVSHPLNSFDPESLKEKIEKLREEREMETSASGTDSSVREASGEHIAKSDLSDSEFSKQGFRESQNLSVPVPSELSSYVVAASHNQVVFKLDLLDSKEVYEKDLYTLLQLDNGKIVSRKRPSGISHTQRSAPDQKESHEVSDRDLPGLEIGEVKLDESITSKEQALMNQDSSDSAVAPGQYLTNVSNLDKSHNPASTEQTDETADPEIHMSSDVCQEYDAVMHSETDAVEGQDLKESGCDEECQSKLKVEAKVNEEKNDPVSGEGDDFIMNESEFEGTGNSELPISGPSELEKSDEGSLWFEKIGKDKDGLNVSTEKTLSNKGHDSGIQISDGQVLLESVSTAGSSEQNLLDEQEIPGLKSSDADSLELQFPDEEDQHHSGTEKAFHFESVVLHDLPAETISSEMNLSDDKDLQELELEETYPALLNDVSATLETDTRESLESESPDKDRSTSDLAEPYDKLELSNDEELSEDKSEMSGTQDMLLAESPEESIVHSKILYEQNLTKAEGEIHSLESGVTDQLNSNEIYYESDTLHKHNVSEPDAEIKLALEKTDLNPEDILVHKVQVDSRVTESQVTDMAIQKPDIESASKFTKSTETLETHLQDIEPTGMALSELDLESSDNHDKPYIKEEEPSEIDSDFGSTINSSSELQDSDTEDSLRANSDETNAEANPVDEHKRNLNVSHATYQDTKVFEEEDWLEKSEDGESIDQTTQVHQDTLLQEPIAQESDEISSSEIITDEILTGGLTVDGNNFLGLETIIDPSEVNDFDEGMAVTETDSQKSSPPKDLSDKYLQESEDINSGDTLVPVIRSENEISFKLAVLTEKDLTEHERAISVKDEFSENFVSDSKEQDTGFSTIDVSDDQKPLNNDLDDADIVAMESTGNGSVANVADEIHPVENISVAKHGYSEMNALTSEDTKEIMPEPDVPDLINSDLELKSSDGSHHTMFSLGIQAPMDSEHSQQQSEIHKTDLEEVAVTSEDREVTSSVNLTSVTNELQAGGSFEVDSEMQKLPNSEVNVSEQSEVGPDQAYSVDSNDAGEEAADSVTDKSGSQVISVNVQPKESTALTRKGDSSMKDEIRKSETHSRAPDAKGTLKSESQSEGIGYVRRIASSFTRLVKELNKEKVRNISPARSVSERLDIREVKKLSEFTAKNTSAFSENMKTKISADETGGPAEVPEISKDEIQSQPFDENFTMPKNMEDQLMKDDYRNSEAAVLEVSVIDSGFEDRQSSELKSNIMPASAVDSHHSLLLPVGMQGSVDYEHSSQHPSEQEPNITSGDKEWENSYEVISESVESQTSMPLGTSSQMNSEMQMAQPPETNASLLGELNSNQLCSTHLCGAGLEVTECLENDSDLQSSTEIIQSENSSPNGQYSFKQAFLDSVFRQAKLTEEKGKSVIESDFKEQKSRNCTPEVPESDDIGYVRRIAAGFNLLASEPSKEKVVSGRTESGTPDLKQSIDLGHDVTRLESTVNNGQLVFNESKVDEPGERQKIADMSDTSEPKETQLPSPNDTDIFSVLDGKISQTEVNEDENVHLSAAEVTEGTDLVEDDSVVAIGSDYLDELGISDSESLCPRELCASYSEETFVNQVIDDMPPKTEAAIDTITSDHLLFSSVVATEFVSQAEECDKDINATEETDVANFNEKSKTEESEVKISCSNKELDSDADLDTIEFSVHEDVSHSELATSIDNVSSHEVSLNTTERDCHSTYQDISLDDEDKILEKDSCFGKAITTVNSSTENEFFSINQNIGTSNISDNDVGTELDIEETSGIDKADNQFTRGYEIMDSSFMVEIEDTDAENISTSDIDAVGIASVQADVADMLPISAGELSDNSDEETTGDDTDFFEDSISIEVYHRNTGELSLAEEIAKAEIARTSIDAESVEIGTDLYTADVASHKLDTNEVYHRNTGELSLAEEIAKAEIAGTSIDAESMEIGTDLYTADIASYKLGTNDVKVEDEGAAEADLLDLEDIEVATVFANALDLDVIEGDRIEVLSVEVPEGGDDGETIDVSAMFADVVEVENITSGTPDIDVIGTRTPDLGRIESRFIDKVAYRRYAAKTLRSDGIFTPTDTLDSESADDTEIIFASEADVVSDFEESVGIDAADEERIGLESTGAETMNIESSRKYSIVSIGSEPIAFFNEAYLSQNDDPNLSFIEEAPIGREDFINSVEIAMENTVATSDFEKDDQLNTLGDDSDAIPFDRDRRASVSSSCSSVGRDIEDLIIAISKTAYIDVASVSHSDQVEPVTEALETDEVAPSENLNRKLSSASTSSSVDSSSKTQTNKLFSSVEMNGSSDDDDDFTLTDTSVAGTEIDTEELFSMTSTEDEFERSNHFYKNIRPNNFLCADDVSDGVEMRHRVNGEDFTVTCQSSPETGIDTGELISITTTNKEFDGEETTHRSIQHSKPFQGKSASDNTETVHQIVTEATEISARAGNTKEEGSSMRDAAGEIAAVEALDLRVLTSTNTEVESGISVNNGDPYFLDTDATSLIDLRHASGSRNEVQSLEMSPDDSSKKETENETSQPSEAFSVFNITEAVIITNSDDNSETLIGTVKYSLLHDDMDQQSPRDGLDLTESTASPRGNHVSVDEPAQTASSKSGAMNRYFEDISKESRTPTPSGINKYLSAITEESRTPTPTGIMRYFDVLTKVSRTPTPTGIRKYFSSLTKESRTPTPTKNFPTMDTEVEKVSAGLSQDSHLRGIGDIEVFEVETSDEMTEAFDVEVVAEVDDEPEPLLVADAAVDIAETIIGSQEPEKEEEEEEPAPKNRPEKRVSVAFVAYSSVSQMIAAELESAANQVEKAESLLSLATSQLTEALTTVSQNESKQPSAKND